MAKSEPKRCSWAGDDPAMRAYHDSEWGVPLHDDAQLFEFLVLEGAQAGLSWSTVLNKRAAYRKAFHGFDVDAKTIDVPCADQSAISAERGAPGPCVETSPTFDGTTCPVSGS